jgi:hypothetical protein
MTTVVKAARTFCENEGHGACRPQQTGAAVDSCLAFQNQMHRGIASKMVKQCRQQARDLGTDTR